MGVGVSGSAAVSHQGGMYAGDIRQPSDSCRTVTSLNNAASKPLSQGGENHSYSR